MASEKNMRSMLEALIDEWERRAVLVRETAFGDEVMAASAFDDCVADLRRVLQHSDLQHSDLQHSDAAPACDPAKHEKTAIKRSETEIMRDIGFIYAEFGCDGELSRRQKTDLNRRLRACFNELGREVSESEFWEWCERGASQS